MFDSTIIFLRNVLISLKILIMYLRNVNSPVGHVDRCNEIARHRKFIIFKRPWYQSAYAQVCVYMLASIADSLPLDHRLYFYLRFFFFTCPTCVVAAWIWKTNDHPTRYTLKTLYQSHIKAIFSSNEHMV